MTCDITLLTVQGHLTERCSKFMNDMWIEGMCDKLSYTPNDIFHQQSRKQEKTCFSRAQSHCGSQEKAVKCILIINSLSSMMELRCPAASHEILWHRFMQWCNSVCLQYIKLHLKVTCYPTTSTFTLTVIAANSWKDLPHDT